MKTFLKHFHYYVDFNIYGYFLNCSVITFTFIYLAKYCGKNKIILHFVIKEGILLYIYIFKFFSKLTLMN